MFPCYFQEAENDIIDVDEAVGRVQKLSIRLANHYCENENSFKVDEFLEGFKEFCEKCKSCQQDIETWRVNEEKAEMRRKTQAELAEKRRSKLDYYQLEINQYVNFRQMLLSNFIASDYIGPRSSVGNVLATDASLTADRGVTSLIPARFHTFVEIDYKIISTVILLPSAESFKKDCCQLQAKVCA